MTPPVLNRRLVLGAGAAGLAAAAASGVALAAPKPRAMALPVSGIASNGSEVFGTFTPQQFVVDATTGALAVTGLLTLTGGLVRRVVETVTMAVASLTNPGGVCTILDLTLGPLDLNLLGLRIQLNQINLLITANPLQGLLGALLCAIAGLLNPGGALADLVAALNQLLDLFG